MRNILVAAMVGLALLAGSPANAEAPLSSYEQGQFDRGLAAAKQQQWDQAIKSFLSACPDCRFSPAWFNLGLAFEKADRPIPAAASLQAYLALAPNAANAAAARQEIGGLEKASEAKLASVFKLAEENANRLEPDMLNQIYGDIALSYARSGDIDNARRMAARIKVGEYPSFDLVPAIWMKYLKELGELRERPERILALLDSAEKNYPEPPYYKDTQMRTSDMPHFYADDEYRYIRSHFPGCHFPPCPRDPWLDLKDITDEWKYDLAARIREVMTPTGIGEKAQQEIATFQEGPDYAIVTRLARVAGDYGELLLRYRLLKEHFKDQSANR